jgi:6-phosphogluconolactonase
MKPVRHLFVAGTADDVAREAASRFVEAASRAISERGRFSVALSGGSTPRRLYALLTQPPYLHAVDWSRVCLFFADERYVPPEHPDSTLRLVRETLLVGAPVPPDNVFPMPTQGGSPEEDGAAYAATLEHFFGAPQPAFDLILLGMGPDGHTASLFPGHRDHPGLVAAIHDSPKPPPVRLTLTLDAIEHARAILFLVTGADKALALKTVFETKTREPSALPASRVMAADGKTFWLVDREAGARILEYASA